MSMIMVAGIILAATFRPWFHRVTPTQSAPHALRWALLNLVNLLDTTLVASTLKVSKEPKPDDLFGKPKANNPRSDSQHIGIIVLA